MVSVSNFRLIVKSIMYGDAMWVSFTMIDAIKRTEEGLLVSCKDARQIRLVGSDGTYFFSLLATSFLAVFTF